MADEKKINPNAKADEAWGWLPPPLIDEGRKVQTDWLHDFLLDPYPIRPAAVLRMPKFNMSTAEATALVNYFAAVDNADYPYDFDPRTRASYLAAAEAEHPNRTGRRAEDRHRQQLLREVPLGRRLRADGQRPGEGPAAWTRSTSGCGPTSCAPGSPIPSGLLPYTGMPVNIPPDKPVSQDLYKGTAASSSTRWWIC